MRFVVHDARICFFAAAIVGCTLGHAREALAVDADGCVAAYEQAQLLRGRSKLRRAREELLVCAQSACPKFIATDCTQWLSEVDANTPTVVISARDESGQEITAVRVKADGEHLLDGLDGKAVPLDPGPHVFRFERGALRPVEKTYVIHEGERNRAITVELRGDSDMLAVRSTGSPAAAPVVRDDAQAAGRARWALVLGALGAVGVGSFAYFGLTGHSDVEQMRSQCAPACAQSDVDAAKTKLLIADGSLGLGIASLGLATWLLFSKSRDATSRPAAQTQFWATTRGGTAELGVTF
jgi:hypothetical protein